jgi:8-hydroxy-5-deazaflavin:NADPH oxidoreductase
MKKIGIIGTGVVGQTFASKLVALGYDVTIGTRDVSEKLASTAKDAQGNPPFSEWHAQKSNVKLGTFAEAAAFGELILNVTHGAASINALKLAGEKNLKGKIIMDVANLHIPANMCQLNRSICASVNAHKFLTKIKH